LLRRIKKGLVQKKIINQLFRKKIGSTKMNQLFRKRIGSTKMNQWETKNVSKPYLLPPVLSFWNADKTLVFCADDPFNASVFNPASREEEERRKRGGRSRGV